MSLKLIIIFSLLFISTSKYRATKVTVVGAGNVGATAANVLAINEVASKAEKNQNAFTKIAVGNSTIEADSISDTVTLVAGTNITLTPDATNDKITINFSNPGYVTSSGITAVQGDS